MRIAILQPTFLPWLGWFDIADQVDMLVILDDVAFSKQSWQQRNRIRTANGLEYCSVPVFTTGRTGQLICEVEISDLRFLSKLERTVRGNYAKSSYFNTLFPGFQDALHNAATHGKLAQLNIDLLNWFWDMLGLKTPRKISKSVDIGGKRGEYVAGLCEKLGADEYLSPAGAEAYLLDDYDFFKQRNISVWLHEYAHPLYRQVFEPFIPYASTLDLLFNEGPRALEIIQSGRRPSRALCMSKVSSSPTGIYAPK